MCTVKVTCSVHLIDEKACNDLLMSYLLLFMPHIFVLQRAESVKIDARDVNGKRFSISLSELPARVFLHEFDHLQVCFST